MIWIGVASRFVLSSACGSNFPCLSIVARESSRPELAASASRGRVTPRSGTRRGQGNRCIAFHIRKVGDDQQAERRQGREKEDQDRPGDDHATEGHQLDQLRDGAKVLDQTKQEVGLGKQQQRAELAQPGDLLSHHVRDPLEQGNRSERIEHRGTVETRPVAETGEVHQREDAIRSKESRVIAARRSLALIGNPPGLVRTTQQHISRITSSCEWRSSATVLCRKAPR